MNSRDRQPSIPAEAHRAPTETPAEFPEWLERVRLTVENEALLMQALMRRAISAVLDFSALSEESIVNATAAPTNLTVLVRALSSGELPEDLKAAEPLAPASPARPSRNVAAPANLSR